MKKLSEHGGHIGPNLGMVEATVALHYVFDSPQDQFVFDVSHQCYPHKVLTGRKNGFLNPAEYDTVSGYTNPDESEHDFFKVGHTSTSISLACGLAKARDLKGEKRNIVAVIGDGSLSGGEALEGLDNAGEMNSNLIIVFNDNQMSIAENHGGMYRNLEALRDSNGTCPCNLFRAMGLDYRYVTDGNDIPALIAAFAEVKDVDHPVVVHINTVKDILFRRCKTRGFRSGQFVEMSKFRRPRNRHNPRFVRKRPDQGELRRSHVFTFRPFFVQTNQCHILLHRFGGETWQNRSAIRQGETTVFVERSGQEPASQQRVGDKTDAEFLQRRKNLGFRFAPPDRIFALDRRKRLNRMAASNGFRARFGPPPTQNFSFTNQLSHGSRHRRCHRAPPVRTADKNHIVF